MDTRILASAAITLLVMGACTSVADTAAKEPQAAPTPDRSQQARTNCSRSEVRQLVLSTVEAYNEGDLATLDTSFALEPKFQWYSRTPTLIRDRDNLLAHFKKVSQRGEQLKVLDLYVIPKRGRHGGYDFIIQFKGRQGDGPWSRRFGGKGSADCQIFIWSLGGDRAS